MTPDEARAVFTYEPSTGELRWRIRAARCVRVGDVAGFVKSDGYVGVLYRQKAYAAHRVAWAIVHGEWPYGPVDHINGTRSDNRMENLRQVTAEENMQNQSRAHRNNKSSGILGVHFYARTGRWRATIWLDGKNKFLGYHATAAEAERAYLDAKQAMHPGFVGAAV